DRAEAIIDAVARAADEALVADTRRLVRSAAQTASLAAKTGDQAERLQLRASELATLEAWGRAFRVLLPAKQAIEQAPGFAIGFAELAWRAGEFEVAREVLARMMPADAIRHATETWSAKMGWSDATPDDPGARL